MIVGNPDDLCVSPTAMDPREPKPHLFKSTPDLRPRPRLTRRCSYAAILLLAGLGCTPKPAKVGPEPEPEPEQKRVTGVPLHRQPEQLPPRSLPTENAAVTAVPLSLTASDGTGLKLVSLQARAVVQGPLAFTELHLTFDNPENRRIEGRFTIDLPPDSAISRFAMKIDSRWQEGEVVERQAARVAYEDFLHRKQDPALLENETGNRFSARVFPIPARGRKELILSYSQELSDSAVPYKLMLAGLPKLEQLDVEVLVDTPKSESGAATSIGGTAETRKVIRLNKENYVPDRDLEVSADKADAAIGLRNGRIAVARIPVTGSMPPDPIKDLTILFDTSASRALDFDGQIRRLHALIADLSRDANFRLRVVAFDQDVSLVFEGDATDFGTEQADALYARQALGASDLTGALRALAQGEPTQRVLVMSDGIATAGLSEVAALTQGVEALEAVGVERLDAIIDGGLQDGDALAAMTTAGLARDGIVVDATLPPSEITDKLSRATLSDIKVSVPDSTFSWPTTLNGVQPGDEVLVYAQVPETAAMSVILEGEQRAETKIPLLPVSRPLVHRALIGAQIESMTLRRSELGTELVEPRKELAKSIVKLSVDNRVLSNFTALLVLETEADYARFNIDRKALTDILAFDASGLKLLHRKYEPWGLAATTVPRPRPTREPQSGIDAPPSPDSARRDSPADSNDDEDGDGDVWGGLTGTEVGEAYGVGGLGLVGTGRGGGGTGEGTIGLGNVGLIGKGGGGGTGSGYGRGSGAGFGGRGKRVPRVRQGKASVRGSLDKDIVRRIVRRHINEVRHCYNQGLVRDPSLAGRVTIDFDVDTAGAVGASKVRETTLPDRKVAACINKAVKRWRFPRPSGSVHISYPFVLGTGGSATPLPPPPPPTPEELEAERIAEEERRVAAKLAAERADSPYEGRMYEVMKLVENGSPKEALAAALLWRSEAPGDVLALIALGEALEKSGKQLSAARAYGSIIDLFPSRADLRRFAGSRLDRLGTSGRRLAIDTYRNAVEQRPDHPNSHRQYAYALLRGGQPSEALDAILLGAQRTYPGGRFRGIDTILREDAGLIAAALIKGSPGKDGEIRERMKTAGISIPSEQSTRFVISWETDANDVDFHVHDKDGGHAFFSQRDLDSGGKLYADVTTGYGPECFNIPGKPTAFPYRFEAHYYSRGPMGYGMGTLQIVQHDGSGGLSFDDRPFVIMKDRAYVKLGEMTKPLP